MAPIKGYSTPAGKTTCSSERRYIDGESMDDSFAAVLTCVCDSDLCNHQKIHEDLKTAGRGMRIKYTNCHDVARRVLLFVRSWYADW